MESGWKFNDSPSSVPSKRKPPAKETKARRNVVQAEERPPDPPREPEPPQRKRPAWLDRLTAPVKPDEDLHKRLVIERKQCAYEKHFELCAAELEGIYHYAVGFHRLSQSAGCNLTKFLHHIKADFFAGTFVPPPKRPESDCGIDAPPPRLRQVPPRPSVVRRVLARRPVSVQESLRGALRALDVSEFEFDMNPELNVFLQKLSLDMRPFTDPDAPPEPLACPFVICVVGPPCSGRTTVCNFLARHFKLRMFDILAAQEDGGDPEQPGALNEKSVLPAIVREIANLPAETGMVIQNFPMNRPQMVALEKAFAVFAKQRKEGISVSLVIRTSLSYEEAERQGADRLVKKSTGEVLHPQFNPPSVLDLAADEELIESPPTLEPQPVHDKINQSLAGLDQFGRRATVVVNIPFTQSVHNVHLQIENGLRQVYEFQNIPVPFTSFVNPEKNSQLAEAKLCRDLLNLWNETCVPLFANELATLISTFAAIPETCDYLEYQAFEKLLLTLARPDGRCQLADFREIWDKSSKIRDAQAALIANIVANSGFPFLKDLLGESRPRLLMAIISRLYIVKWFTTTYPAVGPDVRVREPEAPRVRPGDLSQCSALLGVPDFMRASRSLGKKIPMVSSITLDPGKTQRTHRVSSTVIAPPSAADQPDDVDRNFLLYLSEAMPESLLQFDIDLMVPLRELLLDQHAQAVLEIERRFAALPTKLRGWVEAKYSREMETFATNYRRFKDGGGELPVFAYDFSFVDQDSLVRLLRRLGPKLPSIDDIPQKFPAHKLAEFVKGIDSEKIVDIEKALDAARAVEFDDDELAELEICVRMTMFPEFVHVKSLLAIIAPSKGPQSGPSGPG
jgi:hypothetical protein